MPRGNHKTSKLTKRPHGIDELIDGLYVVLNNPPPDEPSKLKLILKQFLVHTNDTRVIAVVNQIMKAKRTY